MGKVVLDFDLLQNNIEVFNDDKLFDEKLKDDFYYNLAWEVNSFKS